MKGKILTTDQVRGILDGRVTTFREPIKDKDITNRFDIDVDGKAIAYIDQATGDSLPPESVAPYRTGDTIYVREGWEMLNGFAPGEWEKLFPKTKAPDSSENMYFYKADYSNAALKRFEEKGDAWRSPATMPRDAARLFLRVVDMKVERVQDATLANMQAEGLFASLMQDPCDMADQIRDEYRRRWNTRYAKRYPFDANPWTLAVTFEVKGEEA